MEKNIFLWQKNIPSGVWTNLLASLNMIRRKEDYGSSLGSKYPQVLQLYLRTYSCKNQRKAKYEISHNVQGNERMRLQIFKGICISSISVQKLAIFKSLCTVCVYLVLALFLQLYNCFILSQSKKQDGGKLLSLTLSFCVLLSEAWK